MKKLRIFFQVLLIQALFCACTDNPEDKILGSWLETKWEYEDYKIKQLKEHDPRIVRRHQTERWIFNADESFIIVKKNGEEITGRWSLLGRGHILKLHYDENDEVEVYDIKELNHEELVLNIDIGMEIKGVARLFFTKI